MDLSIPDMNCGHCKASITTALTRLDPTSTLDIDLPARKVTLTTDKPAAEVIAALDAIGFDASVL